MPGQPAARVGDDILCVVANPVPPGPPTHSMPPGNPIGPPGATSVKIGGARAARIGDKAICDGPSMAPVPNVIIRGAMPVRIENSPAARLTDSGSCPGSMIVPPCCPKVLIGLAGTAGNPWEGLKECEQAKQGRISADPNAQSYYNCGVESSRQIINRTGGNQTEDGLLSWAMKNNLANKPPQVPVSMMGGTSPAQWQGILNGMGVPASGIAPGLNSIATAVAQGRGVIAGVDAGSPGFWPSGTPPHSAHAVLVTGAKYDDNGDLVSFIINDTGIGECGKEVPMGVFEAAVHAVQQDLGEHDYVATDNPIW